MVYREGRKLCVGFVGYGHRGVAQLSALLSMPDVQVVAVCDFYQDRADCAGAAVAEKSGKKPFVTTDYREILAMPDVEAVVIVTSWQTHARIAVAAMKAGKHVGMEVSGASSLEECWHLVRTAEDTGRTCMMLENCCYGKVEMQILNMVKKGLFGELVHCQGGYQHDLRSEIGRGDKERHYRQDNFISRNGEVYPTHELGPIAKLLDINRGNRMLTLTSMASKAVGLHEWLKVNRPGEALSETRINQADIVTTMIKCANGETICLLHDCSLPRPYSRGGRVQGTKGIWMEDNASMYIEGLSPLSEREWEHGAWEPLANHPEFEHPLWKEYAEFGVRGEHDGMDYLVMRAFIESVQNGTTAPIDVYDTASWMAITCLSEASIAMGSMPVAIPDFTDGEWVRRDPLTPSCYALDDVYEDLYGKE